MDRIRAFLGDASGAVADLGVLIPIATGLVLKNGLDAATVLVGVGTLYIGAGLYFGLPVPVQPIKAASAIALARDLPDETLVAAGIVLGGIILVLGLTGAVRPLTRVFAKPLVRGLQLGVGLLLLRAALGLVEDPEPTLLLLAAVMAALLVFGSVWIERVPLALLVVLGGIGFSLWIGGSPGELAFGIFEPRIADAWDASSLWSAFVLLVIPQLPLTFGNAVVAVSDLERQYFGARAERATPRAFSVSCGFANLVAGTFGAMPMCHGSGGLTAHYRAGARGPRMNLLIGGTLLVLGLTLGPSALRLLALIPIAVLMGLLLFTGALHATLVRDLSGYELAIAIAMGIVGFLTSNLAIALALGLVTYWPARWGGILPSAGASRRAAGSATGARPIVPERDEQRTEASSPQ